MRTDSVRISDQARAAAKTYIERVYSPAHVPAKPHVFKNPKKAQDAHEAIRPAHLDFPPDRVKPFLKKEEYDLYRMIWNRFIASQMAAAVIEETEFDVSVRTVAVAAPTTGAKATIYGFKAKGQVVKFDGFLAAYPNGNGEKELLPKAREGETLKLLGLESKQKFTEPPPRYTEGTLVKELESRGIGRPSTYAPIIATLQDRTYVVKDTGKFSPTELGMFVTDFLVKFFADLMDYKFTAHMEEELDEIGDGEQKWVDSLREYYALLERDLKKGQETEGVKRTGIPIDETCPKCGQPLVIKDGRFGRFKACSGYPKCKFRESLVKKESRPLDEKCPKCGSNLVQKFGKFGPFIACSDYPKCKYIKKETVETGLDCPVPSCGGKILLRKTRRGKLFYGCSHYPKCTFATWDEPVNRPCPACGQKFLLKKHVMKGEPYLHCWNEKCAFKETVAQDKIWDKAKKEEEKPGTDEQGTH
jgi:DNA topoisomerase-1